MSRISVYSKAYPLPDHTPPSYFCPAPSVKHRFDLDDERNYLDWAKPNPHTHSHPHPHRDPFNQRTMPLRHSCHYQPHSIDKAEVWASHRVWQVADKVLGSLLLLYLRSSTFINTVYIYFCVINDIFILDKVISFWMNCLVVKPDRDISNSYFHLLNHSHENNINK